LTLCASLTAATVTLAPPAAAFRGRDGEILADTGDPAGLVAIAPDGSETRSLGPGAAGSWSPVGSEVVFEDGGHLTIIRSPPPSSRPPPPEISSRP
jgi:hypothetical protein